MKIKKIRKVSKDRIAKIAEIRFDDKKNQFVFHMGLSDDNAPIFITIQAEHTAEKIHLPSVYTHLQPCKHNYGDYIVKEVARDFSIKLIEALLDFSCSRPLSSTGKGFWLYNEWLYKANREYEPDEARLLILEEIDKERQLFERLKRKFDLVSDQRTMTVRREKIPEEVRIFVWRRDEGKCAKCGSRENLEYDHIIPVSEGGGNTERNIELLCEECNRRKGASIQ